MTQPRLRPTEPQGSLRCPYCRQDFVADEGVECASCRARHHPGCFEEHGSCSTHACGSQAATAVNDPDATVGSARVALFFRR